MYRYKIKDEQRGPVSQDEIVDLYQSGTIDAKTLICADGSPIWTQLQLTEIAKPLGIYKETAEFADGHVREIRRDKVKPAGWRTHFFFGSLILFMLGALGMIAGTVLIIQLIEQQPGNEMLLYYAEGDALIPLMMYGLGAVGLSVGFVLSAISYSIMFQHLQANLRNYGSPQNTMPPFMVWLWHFVPFANFYFPIKGMTQIWNGSHGSTQTTRKFGWTIGLWWFCWLVGSVASRLGDRVGANAIGPELEIYVADTAQLSFAISLVGICLLLICAVLMMIFTQRLVRLHKQLASIQDVDVF